VKRFLKDFLTFLSFSDKERRSLKDFAAYWPKEEVEELAQNPLFAWNDADSDQWAAFLASATGAKFKVIYQFHLKEAMRQAIEAKDNVEHKRGSAMTWRFLYVWQVFTLSRKSTAQQTDNNVADAPGARRSLATKYAP
jgi:hypothetical protein